MNTSDDQAPADKGKERCLQPTRDATAIALEPSTTKEPHASNKFQQQTEQITNSNAKGTNLSDHSTKDMPPTDENQQPTVTITPVKTETATHSNDGSKASTSEDETSPRLKTYIDLHNSMMLAQSQSATTSENNDSNTTDATSDAAHIASTLLAAHGKHADLPLMMRAHASLVLACSEREDCYEHMAEARDCIKLAVEEGVLGKEQGEGVLGVTGKLMGLEEEREEGSSESEDENGGEGGEGDDSLP